MRGYVVQDEETPAGTPSGPLEPWEARAVDAVGTVTEFWGFKHNHGRIWALLYLRGEPLAATELQEALELSKGAISMITRELERWGVIHRVRLPGDPLWRFVADNDLMAMVRRVLSEREAGLVARVKSDLAAAGRAARDAPPEARERLERMHRMAAVTERAVDLFLDTAKIDLAGLVGVLRGRSAH